MTPNSVILFFAQSLLTLKEDPRAFEKFYKRAHAKMSRLKYPGKAAAARRKYRKENPEQERINREKFNLAHPGYWTERQRERAKTPEGKTYRREYENARRKKDSQWRIKKSITTDILQALKRTKSKKHARTGALLGCTIPEFMDRIAKGFSLGMTWENHGPVWHLDHIRPKRSFDLNDPVQQAQCFHWSNWQPLSTFENQSKGAKWNGVDWRFQNA